MNMNGEFTLREMTSEYKMWALLPLSVFAASLLQVA